MKLLDGPGVLPAMEHRCGYRRSLEAVVVVRTRSGAWPRALAGLL